ncbi:MAG: FmdB family transcriptional regulator [Phycisphaerae bacterium]|nr:MAG: zinc ribbon domain-containing protein [Planctomycetia bacterium]RIK71787.1 MAG: FmdB family transcriptional regulator [Planctomycetota bacterium]GJQ25489.1 MAG: FmdB family transcriptional regulator [Phycisphaerae bacterium]
MPTYEYRCDNCQTVFEVFQSIKASPLRRTKCESCCKVTPVKRLIGPGGAVLFKGSGFYQTDYRSESYHKAAKAEAAEAKPATAEAKSPSTATPTDGAAKSSAPVAADASKGASPGKEAAGAKATAVSKHPGKPGTRRKK